MKLLEKLVQPFRAKPMTRGRMVFALAVAVVADGLQVALSVPGAFGLVQIIDVGAMILTTLALGFHFLLLPTFIVELVPVVDMLPTWTACTAAVIAWRKRAENAAASPEVTTDVPKLENPPKS